MRRHRWAVFIGVFFVLGILIWGALRLRASIKSQSIVVSPNTVSGIVLDSEGPVAEAIVRVQTKDLFASTDDDGTFSIDVSSSTDVVFNLTAWAAGYFCVGPVEVLAGEENIIIQLSPHADLDNPDYSWLPSIDHPGEGENQGCAQCHSAIGSEISFTLPFDEWLQDAHSQAAQNPRFLTMYLGTDTEGNQSPLRQYFYNRDYGRFPLKPDFSQPYYGPGYKLDFPVSAGNCAACHAPVDAVDKPYEIDPSTLTGVAAEGIPCDFCHKVWDVILEPSTQLPYTNMPGVLSFEFRRPEEGHQFFAGPLDDVAPGEDTYSPLQETSQFCAPCHFGIFWDTLIYNSYGEWLESSYSDPVTGQTCQDCHMPPLGVTHFALPEAGGLSRQPETIFSHRMPGANDEELLQNAVNVQVDAAQNADVITIGVTIINDNTGHHIPTDSPLRQLILLVRVEEETGQLLEFLSGPTLPDWTGIGDPSLGFFAGLPGEAYAKILQEMWTEITPTGAYWNPTIIVSDNRIAAFAEAYSEYQFKAEGVQAVNITVQLILRRAFIDLIEWKKWNSPDIEIFDQTILLEVN